MNAGTIIPLGAVLSPSGTRGPSAPAGEKGPPGGRGERGTTGNRAAVLAMPVGAVLPFGGQGVPGGWLLCDGATYNVATYPALHAVIGYNFGGSGSQFQVPDTKGRALVGAGGLDTEPGWVWWVGRKGGLRQVVLSIGQIPFHSHQFDINHHHGVALNAHGHGFNQGHHDHGPHRHNVMSTAPEAGVYGGSPNNHDAFAFAFRAGFVTQRAAEAAWSGGSVANAGNMGGSTNWVSQQVPSWHLRNTDARGASWGHENVQPSLGIRFIIRAT